MKFGETFMEYLRRNQGRFLNKCCYVEYQKLKMVLESCQNCRAPVFNDVSGSNTGGEQSTDGSDTTTPDHQLCGYQYQSCPLCDQMFFSELMKEASNIAGCLSSRVRHLLHLHFATGVQRFFTRLCQCFNINQHALAQEGQMLIEYVIMNAIAIRKILKKYDKVHSSVSGRNFKSKLRAKHVEILQSPWLIELVAFYMYFNYSNGHQVGELSHAFSCDLSITEPAMTLILPDSARLEYNLTCAICLDTLFRPYALGCGHLFCKSCACSAASVMFFEGLKAARPETKCPVCREVGVYANAMHMIELELLLKKRFEEYWKERLVAERAEVVKQTKQYWDFQTKYLIGYY